ncbi:MAG: hypothetical protein EOM20_16250 [Spartobacteria bacterium]|nr:hypothetical protein [Spartobacteria bacterium]
MQCLSHIVKRAAAYAVCAVALGALATGCATQQPRTAPEIDTTLMMARSGDKATLQWNTRPDMLYTIMYAPHRKGGAVWKPLPSYTRVPGNGSTVTITDNIPPNTPRHYRLHIEALSPNR